MKLELEEASALRVYNDETLVFDDPLTRSGSVMQAQGLAAARSRATINHRGLNEKHIETPFPLFMYKDYLS